DGVARADDLTVHGPRRLQVGPRPARLPGPGGAETASDPEGERPADLVARHLCEGIGIRDWGFRICSEPLSLGTPIQANPKSRIPIPSKSRIPKSQIPNPKSQIPSPGSTRRRAPRSTDSAA